MMTTETLPFAASPWWWRTRGLWQRVLRLSRRAPRRLRLRESLPLGEHRFVAVIECEGLRLLIGGTPSSLVLLAHLEREPGAAGGGTEPAPSGELKQSGELKKMAERRREARPDQPTGARKQETF